MEISRNTCRLCLSESDFNVSLFGKYSRKTNMVEKILVCLKIVIDDSDPLGTICYKCANNVERYYDFTTQVRKGQSRFNKRTNERHLNILEGSFSCRQVTSYVSEQVRDADLTFSFIDLFKEKETKLSSPLFSYLPPPNRVLNSMKAEGSPLNAWKTPQQSEEKKYKRDDRNKKISKPQIPKNCSGDIFETQSQDEETKGSWKLTPEDNIIKRVREKIFGRSNN